MQTTGRIPHAGSMYSTGGPQTHRDGGSDAMRVNCRAAVAVTDIVYMPLQVVIHTYFKSPVYPVLSDGYYRIDRVPWVPIVPTHLQSAKLFGMFLE